MNFEEDELKDPEAEADFNGNLVDDDDDIFDDGADIPVDFEDEHTDEDELEVSDDIL